MLNIRYIDRLNWIVKIWQIQLFISLEKIIILYIYICISKLKFNKCYTKNKVAKGILEFYRIYDCWKQKFTLSKKVVQKKTSSNCSLCYILF